MVELSADEAAALLEREGLRSPVFDATETASDLGDRLALYGTLETLVEESAPGDPLAFDPRWTS